MIASVLGLATAAFAATSFRSTCYDYVSGGECFTTLGPGSAIVIIAGCIATVVVARSARRRR